MQVTLFCEYVWTDAYGGLRSKNRLIRQQHDVDGISIKQLGPQYWLSYMPKWNFDGSSTGQAPTEESEILLYPVRCFPDPFGLGDVSVEDTLVVRLLVLCDTYTVDGVPCESNYRFPAKQIFDAGLYEKPWYGLEQEFFIIDTETGKPLGFPQPNAPRPQGPYYCSAGAENAFGRSLVSMAYHTAYKAGITVSGMNAEVAPGQWEIQVGPVEGISAGDELTMLRYILGRVGELYSERTGRNVKIEFHAKPVLQDNDSWNGSGMHTNFSTAAMREDGGYQVITDAIDKLSRCHEDHMKVYGNDNKFRLSGKNETSSGTKFTHSVGGRGTSVRIPSDVHAQRKGYFEDRRPSSSADPYLVTSKIFQTCCLTE